MDEEEFKLKEPAAATKRKKRSVFSVRLSDQNSVDQFHDLLEQNQYKPNEILNQMVVHCLKLLKAK